ncbi:MAG: Ig-like domain-containing protein [Myxococcota bacterium]
MNRKNLAAILLALAVPVGAACAADGGGGPEGGNTVVDSARLEVIGATGRAISEFAEETIEIRYLTGEGQPIEGIVDFNIEGDPAGGTLSGNAAPTDAAGIASITLRSGDSATFTVVATAPRAADPVAITFDVAQRRFGTVNYAVDYLGGRPVANAEVALFTNMTCADLQTNVPAPREVQDTAPNARNSFEGVESGVPLAIFAVGVDSADLVAAEGCSDFELDGAEGETRILLNDMGELFGGTYTTVETFDVTEGFDPALNLALDILTGLATDPALYLVEYVANYSGTPAWLATALSSSATRQLVADQLRGAIGQVNVPGYLVDVVDFGAGVDAAFTALTLDGTLTFGEPDEFRTDQATHRLTQVRFPLTGGGEATRPLSTFAEGVEVTVGPEMTISEHDLTLIFGQLIEMVLNDVLYPSLPGSPANTAEFLGQLFDCSALSRFIGGSATIQSVTNAACDIGVTVLGGVIEGYLTQLFEYDTLTLSGSATLQDADMDYDRELLVDGVANARWTGATGTMEFSGSMTGERLDDTTGRSHPVREKMRALR